MIDRLLVWAIRRRGWPTTGGGGQWCVEHQQMCPPLWFKAPPNSDDALDSDR